MPLVTLDTCVAEHACINNDLKTYNCICAGL